MSKNAKFNYEKDSWDVISKFIKENNYNALIRHHLESFDDFMDNKVEQIVKQFNPLSIFSDYDMNENVYKNEIKIEFGDIYYNYPIINENNGSTKKMFPNDARLRNLTYSCNLSVDLKIIVIEDPQGEAKITSTKHIKKVNIGKIPIMVRSKYCLLNSENINTNEECKFDLGGYFIINGNEKGVICQEKIAENKTYVFKSSKSNSKYSHIAEIKSVSNIGFNTPKNVSVKYSSKDTLSGRVLKATIPHCKSDIPLFILFRAFGVISDKEILKYITYNIEDNTELLQWLEPSIEEASIVTNQNDALEYILRTSTILGQPKDIKLSREKRIILFREMIERDVLSHVGHDLKSKALYLGYMVKKLYSCFTNKVNYDDRDSYCNKRVETSGYLMAILFRQYFTKLVKDMRNSIMKELNSGPWKNVNNSIDNVINNNNLYKIIKSTTIESGLKYGLATGNWGIKSTNSKVGIAQVLSRLTYNSTLSHLRRVNTPTEKTGKLVAPRKLHNSQWGIICPTETPEGGSVGLVKNLAIMSYITIGSNTDSIVKMLNNMPEVIKVKNVTIEDVYEKVKIFINGTFNYITENVKSVYNKLSHAKRTGYINIYTSVSFNPDLNEINIYTDAGRCCRPLYILDNNTLRITKNDVTKILEGKYSFNNLVVKSLNENTFDYSDYKPKEIQEGCIEYIDSEESHYKLIAMNYSEIKKKKGSYTHCEIHPSVILGVLASLIPFSNHNQSPRNTYQSAMGKQAMGIYMSNYRNRMDTMGHILYYPAKPIVNTRIGMLLPSNDVPNGMNVIVAIACYGGYNQEDSVLINRGSVERGLFRSTFYRTYKDDEKKIQSSGQEEKFTKPDRNLTRGMKPGVYEKLNPNGFVDVNKHVDSNDIIIGKVMPIKNKDKNEKYIYKDSSTFLRNNESGFIDDIYTNRNGEGHKFCKVRVRSVRIPKIGDKFSSRHGQKGTCGMIINEEDMPFTKDGIRPDIIVNPHAIPSRMTIAQLIECIMGKACSMVGCYGDGTPFMNTSVESISKILEQHEFERNGNEVLYNGFNGKQLDCNIFIGPTYYQRLKHMVEDKIHSRSTGPMVLLTRQPAEGRARDGGLRFGEMERDCMIAHGSLQFLKERIIDVSDNYRVFTCNKCGLFGSVNPDKEIFKCSNCKNYIDFSEIRIPYACKLLIQELESMCIAPRIKVK